jgi:hypothetical protein
VIVNTAFEYDDVEIGAVFSAYVNPVYTLATPEAAPEMDFVAELRDYYCREKISLSFPDAKTHQPNQILDGNL